MKKENSNSSSQFLNTDGGKTKSNAIEIPSISLPKGGGAIKGIDEKFSVNAVNGTASFSIPLPFSPSRGGVSPALSLTYNSGAGNGVFGLGWTLSLPSIKRKTDKGLPQYLDEVGSKADSDTFLFSEAEDLVPEFVKEEDGRFRKDEEENYIIKEKDSTDGLFKIRFYRPRIEGLFVRIEKWSGKSSQEIKWRVITKENVTTLFGWSASSRISDPKDANKIFEWLPEFVFDDKGNCVHYIYKKEDSEGCNSSVLHNRNRLENGKITYTNLYLEKVLYGNKKPFSNLNDHYPNEKEYMFQTVLDYGEYDTKAPYKKVKEWDFRTDAFSEYKAGFEIRTTRLCKRVLLFHHFAELPEGFALVKSLDFGYGHVDEADLTFLNSITSCGYIKKKDGTYTVKKLPSTEFEYQKHDWNKEVKTISSESLIHAPAGLEEPLYQFIDLYSEGLSGILTEQGEGWYYKRNLGDGKLQQAKRVSPKPSFTGLGSRLQLMDLDADGSKQLVNITNEPKGYFELSDEEEWQAFRAFDNLPNINMGDSNARMIDLNGDGKPEVLVTEDYVFTWYESAGRKGFENSFKTVKLFDEEAGPSIVFADPKQTIFLADMSGDGLTDIVRIRNGEVCYWPNLGYGRFGAKVGMDYAPDFDHPDAFNPLYLRLADMTGSGTTDIVYLGKNKFTCWMNLSGNAFSTDSFEIDAFPEIHNQANITVNDLLGKGVNCIVCSSPLSKDSQAPLKYIDVMNSKKPYLMISYKNNLGKEVKMEYTPSTKFYIEDELAGRPWITKLHFPVLCISKTETCDQISGYRFVRSYRYHHGYYDHAEREFRGFGMVEQIDTEHFDHWIKGSGNNVVDKTLHQDPVITKSWFHTGAFINKENILNQFAQEYWYEEMARHGFAVENHETTLPDAAMIPAPGLDPSIMDHLDSQEWREAFRACKGMGLRSEIFVHDADALSSEATPEQMKKQLTPYSAAMQNCVIELLQPKGQNNHAIFVVKESEAVTYSYERNTEDPRIVHTLNIKLDQYGNVLESATVVYPRIKKNPSLPIETQEVQNKTLITYTNNIFTNDINTEDSYRLRLPAEMMTYELKGVAKKNPLYSLDDFKEILTMAVKVDYHQHDENSAPGNPQKRLIEHICTIYRSNNLKDALPLYRLESLALPFESYQLAYTPTLVNNIFGARVTEDMMLEGKFTHREGDDSWWIRSGTTQYVDIGEAIADARNRFYLPVSYTDPYGAKTKVKYDLNYHLYMKEIQDALGNKTRVEVFNFRALSAQRMKDLNNNISEVKTDELGLVKAIAVFGKGDEADDLIGLDEFSSPSENSLVNEFFQAPSSDVLVVHGKSLLQHATARFIYDFDAYKNSGKPVVVASIVRDEHYKKNNNSPVQISFEYSNGHGQVVMKKVQAEPGPAKQVTVISDDIYKVNTIDTVSLNPKQLRWIGNGRTVLNNKGNAVKQYEPYFSMTHKYEDIKELVETGVTPIMHYDALGRLIKTEMPDGTLSRIEFNSWKQVEYDPNDTVQESSWYHKRTNRLIDSELIAAGKDPEREKEAAEKAAKHANTPNVKHFDTLGRPVLSVDHNKHLKADEDEFYLTKVDLDIEGNLRKVIDARGNVVMQYKYDMLGNKLYQNSMDAGQRWMLINILGNPLRTWDERNHEFQYFYDALHRPTRSKVIGGDGEKPLNHIYERIFYGETEVNPEQKNLRGQVIRHYDTGGLLETLEYNFKGQPKSTTRKLFENYKGFANWIDANLTKDLEAESFTFISEMDALGRVTKQIVPDGSIIEPSYNKAGLLNGESVNHTGPTITTVYIKDIEYNEKGQRNKIIYGNDVITQFHYDKETFRLNRLETKRKNNEPLQDWHYTYDPVGNITHIEDKNIPVVFFDNKKITGISTYTYDALYRLAEATGRENNTSLPVGEEDNWNDITFRKELNPGDPVAMREYTQNYVYDAVGNILRMQHKAIDNNWTRDYNYQVTNNRLISTQIGMQHYSYSHHPSHGFITAMPHLAEMGWNFKEELVKTIRQRRTDGGIPEITYYQYDGQGQRIRKITENQAHTGDIPDKKDERIYIGGYELYKQHSGADAGLERTSLSLIDKGHRFVMIDTEIKRRGVLGISMGRTSPVQTVRYQLHNHLGSAALELDDIARVISYEEYHPYGTTAYRAKNAALKCAAKHYRYTGMERDEESGFNYHGARYYAPWIGRWTSCDPIDLEAGVNMYLYVLGNPVRFFDPHGKQECTMCDPNKTQGRLMLNTLKSGIEKGDELAWQTAKLLSDQIWERRGEGDGSYTYSYELSKVKALSQRLGFSEQEMLELADLVRSFAPANRRLQMDYAGRVGTPQNLAEREASEKLQILLNPGSGIGGIFAGFIGMMGGTAADMRVAAEAGGMIEASGGRGMYLGKGSATLKGSANPVVKHPAPNGQPTNRPLPRESERFVEDAFKGSEFTPQRSYKGGQEVPYSDKGSIRPDISGNSLAISIDVKNYHLDSVGMKKLIQNVKGMVKGWNEELPLRGKRGQLMKRGLIIDARGQNLDDTTANELIYEITKATEGFIAPTQIWIIFGNAPTVPNK